MEQVIQGPSAENAFVTALVQEYSVGAKIVAPQNHFGILSQLDETKSFTDNVVLSKKALPWLKTPLFGKIKNVSCYFMPYGFSGTLYFDEEFTLKNGKKARMKLKFQYELQIQDPMKAQKNVLHSDFIKNSIAAEATGTLITFQELKNAIGAHLKMYLRDLQQEGKDWSFDKDVKNLTAVTSNIATQTSVRVFLTNLFTAIGYKANKILVEIERIHYV